MNKVRKISEGVYQLECEDGSVYPCDRWFEKKTGCFHVRLPKGNPSGRQYIRESFFETRDVVEFETKTVHRVLGSSSNRQNQYQKVNDWKSYLDEGDLSVVEDLEAKIKVYYDMAMKKKSMVDLELKISELTKKLEEMKAEKAEEAEAEEAE